MGLRTGRVHMSTFCHVSRQLPSVQAMLKTMQDPPNHSLDVENRFLNHAHHDSCATIWVGFATMKSANKIKPYNNCKIGPHTVSTMNKCAHLIFSPVFLEICMCVSVDVFARKME